MEQAPRPVLISGEEIAARVRTLGEAITAHYAGRRPVFLGVMNGALFFLTDLLRGVRLETEISCIRVASYEGTASTGRVSGVDGLHDSLRGREVLVVDDIFDSGRTIAALVGKLNELGAQDVRICVLLEKRREHVTLIRPDWVGFQIEDEFVVGYGLDYNGRYRNLPGIERLTEAESTAAR
jgi:hypoxanthine phosphoribosyltransferase